MLRNTLHSNQNNAHINGGPMPPTIKPTSMARRDHIETVTNNTTKNSIRENTQGVGRVVATCSIDGVEKCMPAETTVSISSRVWRRKICENRWVISRIPIRSTPVTT